MEKNEKVVKGEDISSLVLTPGLLKSLGTKEVGVLRKKKLSRSGRKKQMRQAYNLEYLSIIYGSETVPTATVRLRRGEDIFQDSACGNNEIKAVFNVLKRLINLNVPIEVVSCIMNFSLNSGLMGGRVCIEIKAGGKIVHGTKKLKRDICNFSVVEVVILAYLNAVNRFLFS